jgi:hypothetical protein
MSCSIVDHTIKMSSPFPPAFAIASPSLELGEAMAKVGGNTPLVEPELSPLFRWKGGSHCNDVCPLADAGLPI